MKASKIAALALTGALALAISSAAGAQAATDTAAGACELHIWPSENYIGINTGLLSGFGIVGALADSAAHDGRVRTVKDLMKDYLGPDIQVEELEKADVAGTLGLAGYRVIIEDALPGADEGKKNPEIKAYLKGIDKKIKAGQRVGTSTAPCYAELITTHIFYHKAMMYGSNLFTGYVFREFDGAKQLGSYAGQVKNPLEEFPPKEEAMIDEAKAELRGAYALNFPEYVQKKVTPKRKPRKS